MGRTLPSPGGVSGGHVTLTNATTSTLGITSLAGGGNKVVIASSVGSLTTVSLPLAASNGGSGASSFGQGWLSTAGGSTAFTASTSPTVYYLVATSTTVASQLPYASTTALSVSGLTSGNCVQASTGGMLTTTSSACSTLSLSSLSATFPIAYNSGTGAFTFSGIGTSSPLGTNQVVYSTGVNTVASVGTSTVTCSGLLACPGLVNVGGAVSITTTATSSNYWYANGNDIYKANTGNVGIGTTSPANNLGVNGYIDVDGKTGGYKFDGNKFIYASSTNFATVMGIGAGTGLDATSTILGDTAIGYQALNTAPLNGSNGTHGNTAVGYQALTLTSTGIDNAALGYQACSQNVVGNNNVCLGYQAGKANTGSSNVFVGLQAGQSHSSGNQNTAVGSFSYTSGSNTGAGNSLFGSSAGFALTGGGQNTFIGWDAGLRTTSGQYNIVLGSSIDVAASTTGSGQLNIGGVIFGTGLYQSNTQSNTAVTNGAVAIGTSTTLYYPFTAASSTGPQIALSDLGTILWTERNAGGTFYLATSTYTATSSKSAFALDTNGFPTYSALAGASSLCLHADTTGKITTASSDCATGGTPVGSDGQLQYKSTTNFAGVSTTTLTFSGPFSGLGFGKLVGGADTTLTWTGLATTSALTANSVLYASNATTGVAPAGTMSWLNAAGWLGIGTSTPQWLLTLATSTKPQLTLTDAIGDAWSFRDAGGTFYLATSSITTFATSTKSAFSIDANGFPTISALAAASGSSCLQVDTNGKITSTGSACAGASASSTTQYFADSTTDATVAIPVVAGDTIQFWGQGYNKSGTCTVTGPHLVVRFEC